MKKVLVHYGEIFLKGKNISYFENKLIDNIRLSAKHVGSNLISIKKEDRRILCLFDDEEERINQLLKNVFGIKYFAHITEIEKDMGAIRECAAKIIANLKRAGCATIAFKTSRSDKSFPLTSIEINAQLGEIANDAGLRVDYKNTLATLFIEITLNCAYVYSKKISGHGGLPVGTAGRTLVLLSGGFDSPVAAWNIMKRGCNADFLHIHSSPTNDDAFKTKITSIVRLLNKFQFKSKIFFIPYTDYSLATQGKVPDRYDLVVFKHYILKVAELIAKKRRYDAIITGDNLSQVASQTIENIRASSDGITIPIFRPLLTYDKDEIISLSKKTGSYDLSVEKYKDCCSMVAKHPLTKVRLDKFRFVLGGFDFNTLVTKSVDSAVEYSLD